jgi:hypothetical protein
VLTAQTSAARPYAVVVPAPEQQLVLLAVDPAAVLQSGTAKQVGAADNSRTLWQLDKTPGIGIHEIRLCSIGIQPYCVLLACRRQHSKRRLWLTAPLMRRSHSMPIHGAWRQQWPTWHASHRTPLQVLPLTTASIC